MRVYKNSKQTIYLDCKILLDSVSIAEVRYRTPSGVTGSKAGTIQADNQSISTIFESGELDETGSWTVWAYVLYDDNNYSYGELSFFNVYNEGE